MKAKTFDCVDMMHRGGAAVRQKTDGMTVDQELAFWQERTEAFERQRRARPAPSPEKKRRKQQAP